MRYTGTLFLQAPTNIVLYTAGSSAAAGSRLVMQTDGNAVIYDVSNRPTFDTGTAGQPGSRLVVQDDGNLVVYSRTNQALWSRVTGRLLR